MRKLSISNLYVSGVDFYFDGDLRIIGDIEFEDANLIVTGNLVLVRTLTKKCSLTIKNGNITAKSFWVEDYDGNVTVPQDSLCNMFSIEDGDINITSGDFNIGASSIFNVNDIFINNGSLICGDIVNSHSIYVDKNIYASSVRTTFDLFCKSGSFYDDVFCGRDMYVQEECDIRDNNLLVRHSFESDILYNCGYIKIGK